MKIHDAWKALADDIKTCSIIPSAILQSSEYVTCFQKLTSSQLNRLHVDKN